MEIILQRNSKPSKKRKTNNKTNKEQTNKQTNKQKNKKQKKTKTKKTKKQLELTAATSQNINKLMFSGVWNGGVGGWSTPFLPHPKI